MIKQAFVFVVLIFIVPAISFAIPPMPCKIGGEVRVDGKQLTQETDAGYVFKVTRPDGTDFIHASGKTAEGADGLNAYNYYIIDIPIHDEKEQPGGARTGESAVIHVYKDGAAMQVFSPVNGKIEVGESGSVRLINIELEPRKPEAKSDL